LCAVLPPKVHVEILKSRGPSGHLGIAGHRIVDPLDDLDHPSIHPSVSAF
jgi:hypothetical protein